MFSGELDAIYVTPEPAVAMEGVDRADLVEGRGIDGDRYFYKTGSYSKKVEPGREVTLIEIEAVEAVRNETGLPVEARDTRRNLVTRNVPLNHLVGRVFRVGDVVLEGTELCEPCEIMERVHTGLNRALLHRGGLRADIVEGGTIAVGDPITPA